MYNAYTNNVTINYLNFKYFSNIHTHSTFQNKKGGK